MTKRALLYFFCLQHTCSHEEDFSKWRGRGKKMMMEKESVLKYLSSECVRLIEQENTLKKKMEKKVWEKNYGSRISFFFLEMRASSLPPLDSLLFLFLTCFGEENFHTRMRDCICLGISKTCNHHLLRLHILVLSFSFVEVVQSTSWKSLLPSLFHLLTLRLPLSFSCSALFKELFKELPFDSPFSDDHQDPLEYSTKAFQASSPTFLTTTDTRRSFSFLYLICLLPYFRSRIRCSGATYFL